MRTRRASDEDDEAEIELLPTAARQQLTPGSKTSLNEPDANNIVKLSGTHGQGFNPVAEAARRASITSTGSNKRSCFYRYRWLLVLSGAIVLIILFSSRASGPVDPSKPHLTVSEQLSGWGLSGISTRYLMPSEAFEEKDGLLYLQDRARPGANQMFKTMHPILHLMEEAEIKWQAKLEGQSKSLTQAVAKYREMYGRAPPKGFDQWYKFAIENQVILIDDYAQIYRDILPFWGLPSKPLRQRSAEMTSDPGNFLHSGSFTFKIEGGTIADIYGGAKDHTRTKDQLSLMERFVQYLPDMNITIWAHDTPMIHIAGEKRKELEDLAVTGKVLPEYRWGDWGDLPEYVGWEAFCKPHSTYRNQISGMESVSDRQPSFISDLYNASDCCLHPENIRIHSLTGNFGIGPRATNIWPLFSHCKSSLFADIVVTPLEQFAANGGKDLDWEEKPDNMILWRGSTTGSRYNRATVWRAAQRNRLNLLTNSGSSSIIKRVYTTGMDNYTLADYDEKLGRLNRQLFDVLFTGAPIQCDEQDGSCEAMKHHLSFASQTMSQDQQRSYKYVMDVDGNGWSGRFHRLMASKSAVLKSTAYAEWWSDRIQPWVHFIPVKMDYSDLHSTASFFIGDDRSPGHDDLGRKIATAGRDWAAKHWRFADMEAYMFRLYLEYARLMNREDHDPTSMDYKMS